MWLWSLLFSGKNGEVYNVGSNKGISIYNLAELIRDTLSPGKNIVVLGIQNSVNSRNRYVPDISKINRHLSLTPRYSLKESILEATRYGIY